tara:strand:- start:114828 stop:115565 length:738 start_codon:yes stop_codon:yes gene_type:complete
MGTLKDCVALVTNVKQFVGLASALALSEYGAKVICTDESFNTESMIKKFALQHPKLLPTNDNDIKKLSNNIIEKYGQIDLLVSNDAFPAIRKKIEDFSKEELKEGLEALVGRPFSLISSVVPYMKEKKCGKIIMITSAAPLRGLPNYSVYATARGAANALTRSLSRELAPYNINVNAIAPNYIESPSYFPSEIMEDDKKREKILRNIPLGRLGKPEEVGKIVSFLASDGGNFITGQIIPVDGGWS